MTLALVFSFALALLALLCLALIFQPELWLRLWSRWSDLMHLRSAEKHVSPAIIQYRALLGVVIFLCGSLLLPVGLAGQSSQNPSHDTPAESHQPVIPASLDPLDFLRPSPQPLLENDPIETPITQTPAE
jgi:hypothetical protein